MDKTQAVAFGARFNRRGPSGVPLCRYAFRDPVTGQIFAGKGESLAEAKAEAYREKERRTVTIPN